jgi:hypothetical protein
VNDYNPPQTSFREHSALRDALNASGIPWFVLGGQACGMWVEYYRKTNSTQSSVYQLPEIVSTDIDIVIPSDVAPPECVDILPGHNAVCGVICSDRLQSNGEVLNRLPGVPSAAITVYEIEGWRVASPVDILQGKLWNMGHVDQRDRKDAYHAGIVAKIIPLFIKTASPTEVEKLKNLLNGPYGALLDHTVCAQTVLLKQCGLSPEPCRQKTEIWWANYIPEQLIRNVESRIGTHKVRSVLLNRSDSFNIVVEVLHPNPDERETIENIIDQEIKGLAPADFEILSEAVEKNISLRDTFEHSHVTAHEIKPSPEPHH